ncbi:hypothetical protein BKA93DRAFT_469046 [Sparassis latifolia]
MDSKIPSLQVLRLLESSKLTYVYSCFLCRTFIPEPPPQTHLKLLLYMCVRTDMHMVIRRGDTHVASRRPHLTRVSSQHPVPLTRASTIGPRPTASATPVPCGTLILVPSEVCFGASTSPSVFGAVHTPMLSSLCQRTVPRVSRSYGPERM